MMCPKRTLQERDGENYRELEVGEATRGGFTEEAEINLSLGIQGGRLEMGEAGCSSKQAEQQKQQPGSPEGQAAQVGSEPGRWQAWGEGAEMG